MQVEERDHKKDYIRRIRACGKCGKKVTTYEFISFKPNWHSRVLNRFGEETDFLLAVVDLILDRLRYQHYGNYWSEMRKKIEEGDNYIESMEKNDKKDYK